MHVERRTVSTIAPPALFLLNDPAIGDAAQKVTEGPEMVAETDVASRIQVLYKLVFGRDPTVTEIKLGGGFVEQTPDSTIDSSGNPLDSKSPWGVYTQALLLSNEFLYV